MAVTFALDSWDRKLIEAAKSQGDRMQAVRVIWGQRCGIAPESVALTSVVTRLAEIVEAGRLASLPQLLESGVQNIRQGVQSMTPAAQILEAVLAGDFEMAKTQAARVLKAPALFAVSPSQESDFTTLWFWTLMNTIQCAPREKFATACTAE